MKSSALKRHDAKMCRISGRSVVYCLVFLSCCAILCYVGAVQHVHQSSLTDSRSMLKIQDEHNLVSTLPRPTLHADSADKEQPSIAAVRAMSSVDYMACCGLGHRITKLSDANYLAQMLGFSLRTFWGFCDDTEVFNHLFGPQPIEEIRHITKFSQYARINNDVPDFRKFTRKGKRSKCPCSMEKATSDAKFYRGLIGRFRHREKVEKYIRSISLGGTRRVIGMHIRAGNGETGDFTSRGRNIGDMDDWLKNLIKRVLEKDEGSSVLFLATDTPVLIEDVKELLKDRIPVFSLDQKRPEKGDGVLFGEGGHVLSNGEECLEGWDSAVMDMIVLSMADVVIAARPSSFTQSMPMSIALSKIEDNRAVPESYCEVNSKATKMICYKDFRDWCCNGKTSFALNGIQGYEYLRLPPTKVRHKKYKFNWRGPHELHKCIPRPSRRQNCLPYNWSEFVIRETKVYPLPGSLTGYVPT